MNKHRRVASNIFLQRDKTDQGKESKDFADLWNSDKLTVFVIKETKSCESYTAKVICFIRNNNHSLISVIHFLSQSVTCLLIFTDMSSYQAYQS